MAELLNTLELEVMRMLLAGEDHVLGTLREQYARCSIRDRKMTGVGFFTHFVVPPDAPRVADRSFTLDDVVAEIPELPMGAMFILFVRHGRIAFLEGCCCDESWPVEIREFQLRYWPGAERDLDKLRSGWGG